MKYKVSDFISIKSAIIGAFIMGGMVYYVNRKFGFDLAIVAALKQAFYTFFLGGIFVRISEVLATKTEKKWVGVMLGSFVATCITTTAVYTLHVIKGTPLPYESTLPTMIFAPPGYIALSWIYRTKIDKLKKRELATS